MRQQTSTSNALTVGLMKPCDRTVDHQHRSVAGPSSRHNAGDMTVRPSAVTPDRQQDYTSRVRSDTQGHGSFLARSEYGGRQRAASLVRSTRNELDHLTVLDRQLQRLTGLCGPTFAACGAMCGGGHV